MDTLTHSIAQALGWIIGLTAAVAALLAGVGFLGRFSNPLASLPLKSQHRLFKGYWNYLERKERYEELEALTPILLAYEDGKQPTRKQLKPYKLKEKKSLSTKGDDFKFVTKRWIVTA